MLPNQDHKCFFLPWISTTCNLPEPCRHWHPWNSCQSLLECPVTLPMAQDPISAQLTRIHKLIFWSGLGCHLQAALVPAGDGLCLVESCLATLFPVSSMAPSPREQPALAQHNNLHKIWSCRKSSSRNAGPEWVLATSQVLEISGVGLGGDTTPGNSAGSKDALSLLLFYGNRNLCFNKKISNHTEFKWNFILQLQTV